MEPAAAAYGKGSGWVMLYPTYLDQSKTIPEGRKVPKESACHAPTLYDIVDVCKELQIPCVVEPGKRYPRHSLMPGRARLRLTDEEGTPLRPDARRRQDLFKLVADQVKVSPACQARRQAFAAAREEAAARHAAAGGGGAKAKKSKQQKKKGGKKR